MKVIYKVAFLIFCLLLNTSFSQGKDTDNSIDYILIINTYNDSNPWSTHLITPIVNMVARNNKIGIYTAHLKMLTQDTSKLQSFEENICNELSTHVPSLIVFIGSASFILCDDLNRVWPDIPMVLCGERDYTGSRDIIGMGHALSEEQRIPLINMQGELNMTMIHANIFLEENIKLMKQLIPQMNKILYIGDETYICQQNDYDLSKIIREKYPTLEYNFISAKETSTDSLFCILNKIDTQTTGVLFSSWLRKKDFDGNAIMTTNSHRIIATSPVPLFSSKTIGIDEEGGIVGGYIYNEENYINHLLNSINEILHGKQAREIPFYHATDAAPTFNYQSLLQRNLDPKRCPQNTVFYNAPPTFWEKYEYIIIGATCIIILLLLIFQYHRLRVLERMKRIQQKELQTTTKYYGLINNMPILYISEELIKNEEGKIIDTKCTDVNKHFEEKFFKRKDIIGRRGSEMFPDSMPQFLHFMNIALQEKRSITFSYYYKDIDIFYDIVVNANGNGRFMDVFCLDSTELHNTQKQLRSINHKLSMALEVANIVPWKWNIQNHTILCDVNKPIELSNANVEINEEQLSVDDSQYFSKIYKEDLPKVKKAYADLIAGRISKVKEEYRVINRLNGIKHVDWVEAQKAMMKKVTL